MPDGSQFLCPRCNLPLNEVRTSGGILYGCNVCGGRAVTIELLRKRFTPESINPLWLHAMRGKGRAGCPCPLCRQTMIGVALSDGTEIYVDVCQRCHFVWFDAHEVDTLVPRQPEPTPVAAELPQKAREMLAMAEVERLSKQAEGPDFDSAGPDESWKQIAAFLGMPVEFDESEEQRKPWATWLLSAVIICASLLAFLNLRELVQRFGLIPAQATRLDGLTFVTSFFLHAGVIHLTGNLYFLLAFGHAVENFLRPLRYLTLIALAAFIGDLAHIALDPRSQIPCIGASGGIAGVITFYALNFPRMRLAFLMRWGWVWFRWIRLPAWFVFVLWFLFQIIGTLEQKAGMSSVSSAAHLGGAAVGILAWLVWRKSKEESRLLE
ncbi:MAG TPA: rhomboid family intramembrane serine protease [Candidatus Udaeobacter sp.]|jgi:membrane associated rhomboid family serine protease/Zn-finger nucleic acid-binding protein|nr:rhomboid family intramembrane serine protease [Candidatus Udaeobacter sp.]